MAKRLRQSIDWNFRASTGLRSKRSLLNLSILELIQRHGQFLSLSTFTVDHTDSKGQISTVLHRFTPRHGFATLMVNYRGSTGYGQEFEDKIKSDQDGGEAKDILSAVDAALAKYGWLDPDRLGIEGISYGGQLTDWLITQTTRFKAAVPAAGISNLVTFNYLAYYHDYMPSEYEGYFDTPQRKDLLWERSALRYANRVKTPVLFIHGANDNDVPTEQAEEYFIALKDEGVETVLVLYPREGHGLRETAHNVDKLTRSLEWYDQHFKK